MIRMHWSRRMWAASIRMAAATICALGTLSYGFYVEASTYKEWSCPIETDCTYSWTLGKLATKEFRGKCSGSTASYPPRPEMFFSNKPKHMTCTVEWKDNKYTSRSCTNWSATKKQSVSIRLSC